MQLTYSSNDNSTYSSTNGQTTHITDRDLGLSFRPGLRMTTKGGNAFEFALEELCFNVANDETILTYDTATAAIRLKGQRTTNIGIGPKVEFNFLFLKNRKTNLKPYLGISSEIFFKYYNVRPFVSNLFNTSTTALGTAAWVIPGVYLSHKKNAYFTCSFPIDVGTFTIKTNKTDNPALPEKTRKTTTLGYDYIATFRLRLAYGIYLK
ncbi:MAG: hypothetical protein JKX73_03515 [Flavobacteriales bacterium]|nr:hypothetical protein [Flavobacteriales bacterium]